MEILTKYFKEKMRFVIIDLALVCFWLLVMINYAFIMDRNRFEDDNHCTTKLKKKHFCSPTVCVDSESVLEFSLSRNRWCYHSGLCGPTSVNTVFILDLEDIQAMVKMMDGFFYLNLH